ncbi:MAG: ExbD/TolR family protein [Chthoniobacteraceae bacterium]
MKLLSPLPSKRVRIEIIPLIDIMFFLLACMMLVSLNMIQMKGMKLNLPTATTATAENKSDFITLSVRKEGALFLDKVEIERASLIDELKRRKAEKPDLRVYIQGDIEALHGDVIAVLDRVRSAGIQKVAFQTKADTNAGGIIDKAPAAPAPSAIETAAPAASPAATTDH